MNLFHDFLYLSSMLKSNGTSSLIKGVSATAMAMTFGLGLSACSDSQVAGGGPSGTEAGNAITAQILTADAKPAALAKVKLIESESIDGSKGAYTAETNKNGQVKIEGVSKGNYTLEATLDGKALQVNVEVTDSADMDLGTAKLGKTAKVSGKVEGSSGIIKVRGMDHSAKVVNGEFDIDSLPAGPLSLVFIPKEKGDTTSSYLRIDEGSKVQTSTFAGESDFLLLEDFQDSNYQNRFMPAHVYDGGWWYLALDTNNVTPTKTSVIKGVHKPILENEDGNISAHVAVTFGDTYEDSTGANRWPWAVIGVELGKSDKKLCNDISSVDSIGFMVKGSGNIVFTLIDETQDEDKREILTYEFSPSSKWDRYSVPVKKLIHPGFSLTCVNQLAWKLSSAAEPASDENPNPAIELWIDDVQLIGGNRLSIWDK